MSVTKRLLRKHTAELVTTHDLECEGFNVTTFCAEMDELLANLGYYDEETVNTESTSIEETPWKL